MLLPKPIHLDYLLLSPFYPLCVVGTQKACNRMLLDTRVHEFFWPSAHGVVRNSHKGSLESRCSIVPPPSFSMGNPTHRPTAEKCNKTSPRKELSKIKGMRTESYAPSKQEENTQWSHPNRWSATEEQINHPKNFTHESPLKYPNQNRKKRWKTKCRPFLLPHGENKRASALPALAAVHDPLPRYVLNFGSETRQRSLEKRLCEVNWRTMRFLGSKR